MANFDIIDYGTIFDFWPLIIIAIGIKLVMDYMAKNKEE
ncbi:LiaI-LiaF-like domain-containing protein [Acidobacteriota bacterium]